jgi:hypothetical protein
VEGRDIGWTLCNGGGTFGEAVAEGKDELDPEEVLVFIFKRGGAVGRLGGGVDEDEPGGLGFLKEGGGVCVEEVVSNEGVPFITGVVVGGGGALRVGIENGLVSGIKNFAVLLVPLIGGAVSGRENMDAFVGSANSVALGFKVDDDGVQGVKTADILAFV